MPRGGRCCGGRARWLGGGAGRGAGRAVSVGKARDGTGRGAAWLAAGGGRKMGADGLGVARLGPGVIRPSGGPMTPDGAGRGAGAGAGNAVVAVAGIASGTIAKINSDAPVRVRK